jgi:XTP/dITP diphosphohydrolase
MRPSLAMNVTLAPMRTYVLCTGNPGKMAELRALLPAEFRLLSLHDVQMPEELPETGNTFRENALQKARYVYDRTAMPCIADDSGLEVDHLNGAPGVLSARYSGENKDASANMRKLLRELEGSVNRNARFRTDIATVGPQGEHVVEGVINGTITDHPRGEEGFGYDPIFIPEGDHRTFAEMSSTEKNRISHRSMAVRRLVELLKEQNVAKSSSRDGGDLQS